MGVAPDLSRYALLDGLLEGCQILGFDWRYLYVNDAVVRHSRQRREDLLGGRITDIFPGIEQTPMFAALRACMDGRAADHLENEFTYPDGSVAWFELRIEPVPEGLFVLSLDITPRKQAERKMQHQVERLRALRAIDLAILGTTDFRVALTTVLAEATKTLRVDAAAILLLSPGTTRLEAADTLGFRDPSIDRLCVRVGEGATGRAALEHRPVIVANAAVARCLSLELAQPLRVGHVHPSEPRSPLVKRGVAEPALPAQILDRDAGFGLLEEPDDLFFAESALLHVRHSPERRTSLPSRWYGRQGAGHERPRVRDPPV